MQSVQNLGLAVVPLIAGTLLDHNGYLILEVFFLVCLCCKCLHMLLLYTCNNNNNNNSIVLSIVLYFICLINTVSLICGVLLYVIDSVNGGTMNLFALTRAKMEKEKELQELEDEK